MSKSDKTPKKKKPAKGAKGTGEEPRDVRLTSHPRAQQQIRRLKGWGALGGFSLAAYAAWHSGMPFVDTVLRSVVWGIVAYLVVWACAQQVWRHLVIAEVRAAEKLIEERRRERAEAAARAVGDETLVMGAGQGG